PRKNWCEGSGTRSPRVQWSARAPMICVDPLGERAKVVIRSAKAGCDPFNGERVVFERCAEVRTAFSLCHRLITSTAKLLMMALLVTMLGYIAPCRATSNFIYNANGRLVAVTTSDGTTTMYTYDAAGNITSAQPITAGQLEIFSFNPSQASPG